MNRRCMKLLLLALIEAGCAAPDVRCDAKLEPINTPKIKVAPEDAAMRKPN